MQGAKLILLPRPLLSAAWDPILPPTHSTFLFISTSWGCVRSFPCRCSLLLPFAPLAFSLSCFTPCFRAIGSGCWWWGVRGWGGAAGNFVCLHVCVCACVLGSELIKDGDPWKALSKDTVNYLMPGPDRRAHAHTFSLLYTYTHTHTHTHAYTSFTYTWRGGSGGHNWELCVGGCAYVCDGEWRFIKLLSLLTNMCNSSWKG